MVVMRIVGNVAVVVAVNMFVAVCHITVVVSILVNNRIVVMVFVMTNIASVFVGDDNSGMSGSCTGIGDVVNNCV